MVTRRLDETLRDDTRDEGYVGSASHTAELQRTRAAQILGISIYVPSDWKYEDELGKRARTHIGSDPDWKIII